MTESYPVSNPRQDEKFALHGRIEPPTAWPRVRRPSHNDLRQILLSQFPKEFSALSILLWFWGSRANLTLFVFIRAYPRHPRFPYVYWDSRSRHAARPT